MLQAIKNWLISNSYCNTWDHLTLSARLCGNWSFLCYINRKLTYFIKLQTDTLPEITEDLTLKHDPNRMFGTLAYEYKVLQNFHQIFPDYIPKPITQDTIQRHAFYLQEAQAHHTLLPKLWHAKRFIQEQVIHFFQERCKGMHSQKFSMPTPWGNEALDFGLKSQLEIAKNLNVLPQHGDFCLNNIGIYKRNIYIFDWEDYARCDYPLLDISSFLVNIYNFNFLALQRSLSKGTQENAWLHACLPYYSMRFEKFVELLPLSLFIFLKLKQTLGYSNEVIAKTKKFIIESLQVPQKSSSGFQFL